MALCKSVKVMQKEFLEKEVKVDNASHAFSLLCMSWQKIIFPG